MIDWILCNNHKLFDFMVKSCENEEKLNNKVDGNIKRHDRKKQSGIDLPQGTVYMAFARKTNQTVITYFDVAQIKDQIKLFQGATEPKKFFDFEIYNKIKIHSKWQSEPKSGKGFYSMLAKDHLKSTLLLRPTAAHSNCFLKCNKRSVQSFC